MRVSVCRLGCALALSLAVGLPALSGEGMVLITAHAPGESLYDDGPLVLLYLSTGQSSTIVPELSNGASFSPDGQGISFGRNGKICTSDLAGGNIQELADCAGPSGQVATTWAQDGYIYWSQNDHYVRRVSAGGGTAEIVVEHDNDIQGLGVSQDGTRAAWSSPQGTGSGNGTGEWGYSASADLVAKTIHFKDASNNYYMVGCQCEVSNDGLMVFSLRTGHRILNMWDYPGGSTYARADVVDPSPDQRDGFIGHRFPNHMGGYVTYSIDGGNFKCSIQSLSNDTVTDIGTGRIWDMYPTELAANPDAVRVNSFAAAPVTVAEGGSSTLSWQTTNATSVSIDNAVGTVGPSGSSQVSPVATTTYTITAEGQSGPATSQVTVTVMSAVAVPFRMNCGSDTKNSGWASDDGYVTGGADYDFATAVDSSGVTDPAPDNVYLSVRHQAPSYSISPIASATYLVRLHFFDQHGGDRAMNVTIEGAQVLSAYDIAAAAGGTSKAVVEEFEVAVADGALDIDLDYGSGNDAFISGIEVLDAGGGSDEDPTVSITSPTGGQHVYDTVAVSGTASDDVGVDKVEVSVSGGAYQQAVGMTGWSTWAYSFDATALAEGNHTITARVTDTSANTSTASVTIVVDPSATTEPSITVITPAGGEVWYVGTTRYIKWTTANLPNVAILYSTDGGQTWLPKIVDSVFEYSAEWGAYPWTVPNAPSADCVIRVEGYKGEIPTDSGTFTIETVTDGDGDGMDDDWELAIFGDLDQDETTDADGDGATDYEEFMAGTNPLAGTSGTSGGVGCLAGGATAGGIAAVMLLAAALAGARKSRAGPTIR